MGIKDLSFKQEIQRLGATQRNIVTLALIGLLVISIACLFEDYSTSAAGLMQVPGNLANPWIRLPLAGAPSLLQIVFVFMAVTQRSKFAGIVAGMAWLFDFVTDMAYKMQGVDPTIGNVIVVALFAFFVASFFSEFMLMFTAQHLAYAAGPTVGGWWDGLKVTIDAARQQAKEQQSAGVMDDVRGTLFPAEDDDDLTEEDFEETLNRVSRGKAYR